MGVVEKKQTANDILTKIISYAHEAGYYQATLEKCTLSDEKRIEYNRLNREAICNRIECREKLMKLLFD